MNCFNQIIYFILRDLKQIVEGRWSPRRGHLPTLLINLRLSSRFWHSLGLWSLPAQDCFVSSCFWALGGERKECPGAEGLSDAERESPSACRCPCCSFLFQHQQKPRESDSGFCHRSMVHRGSWTSCLIPLCVWPWCLCKPCHLHLWEEGKGELLASSRLQSYVRLYSYWQFRV